MAGRPLPARLDLGWLERWEAKAGGVLPPSWFDPDEHSPRHDLAAAINRRMVDELLASLAWLR